MSRPPAAVGAPAERRHIDFAGHQLAYRVSGQGPALVVFSLYRRRDDMVQARLLSRRWQVFQIAPLGYGYSERVPGYTGEALADQVLAVLDRHEAGRFVVWGYSKGAAMAACVARATPRAAGMVCGGCYLDFLTPAILRRLDRDLRSDHPSRSLWTWVDQFDWNQELRAMPCARLLYWGGDDERMTKRLRRQREQLADTDVDFIELPGLDSKACNAPEPLQARVVPEVEDWISERVGPQW